MNSAKSYAKAVLKLLILKNHIHLLPDIIDALKSENDKLSNNVTIESAIKISPRDISLLTELISRKLGYDPLVNVIIDPDLIGGIKIKIGNNVIDATVKNKLAQIESAIGKHQ